MQTHRLKTLWMLFALLLLVLSFSLQSPLSWGILMAQTYSSEEIIISGLGFTRFAVALEPQPAFEDHPESPRWKRIIDRNLCWSGSFKITRSRYASCRLKGENRLDMKILLDVQEQQLIMTVADTEGVPLFPLKLKIRRNNFRESKLMEMVNNLTKELTGIPGILGSTIAFTLKQPARRKIIARVNTHGNKLGAISRNPSISLFPRWSPDSRSILYTILSRQGTAILQDKLKGKTVTLLRSENEVSSNRNFVNVSGGTWFSDGRKLIVTLSRGNNTDLYEFDLRSRREKRLTKHPAIETSPSLSPDNQHLVFVSDRTGQEQIYYKQLGTGVDFRLSYGAGSSSDPAWSPDGTLIAFTRVERGHAQIHMLDPFSGEETVLTRGRYNSEQPAWSPDGKQVVFASNSTGVYKLYLMFVDGTGRRRLTRIPRDFEESAPNWSYRKL